MPDVNTAADAALDRVQKIMHLWPAPGNNQGVRADAVLAGMKPIAALAEMTLKLPVGYQKGQYEGAGYLSGSPTLSEADIVLAHAVLRDRDAILPAAVASGKPLSRALYAQIKGRAYKMLALASDFDISEFAAAVSKVGTVTGPAWDSAVVNVGAVPAPAKPQAPAAVGASPAPRISPMPAPTRKAVDSILASLAGNGFTPAAVTYDEAASRTVTFWFWTDHAADGARPIIPFSIAFDGRVVPFVVSVVPVDTAAGAVRTPTPLEAKAEAAVQRAAKLAAAWPRVAPGQGVRADAVLRAVAPLRTIAVDILARPVGAAKGSIAGPGVVASVLRRWFPLYAVIEASEGAAAPATGYLSGSPVITDADHALAQSVLNLIDVTLPGLGATLIGAGQFGLVKEAAHRLLAVATDCDLDTTAADEVALLWQVTKEAVHDLVDAAKKPVEAGWSLLKTLLMVGAAGAGVYAAKVALTPSRKA